MARVVITITDEGEDVEFDRVGMIVESEPPMPLDSSGAPKLEKMTDAQKTALAVVLGAQKHAGRLRTFTQEDDVVTELVCPDPDPDQRRTL